jgi:hypothetical protein
MSESLIDGRCVPPPHRTCKRKIAYHRRESADKSLGKMMAKRENTHNLHVYECPYCGKWHLGNRTGKEAV